MKRTIEETLRDLPRALERAGIEPDRAALAARLGSAPRGGGRRWLLASVATVAALFLVAALVHLQLHGRGPHPASHVARHTEWRRTYGMARSELGRQLASAPLLVYLPKLEGQIAPQGTIDANFSITQHGYRVSLGYGPKRPIPFNAPQARFGNAELLMNVIGAAPGGNLGLSQWIPLPKVETMKNAAQGTVDLGHGIVATTFVIGAGQGAMEAVTWREGGWTFWVGPWAPAEWGNPTTLAVREAASYLDGQLPGQNGVAVYAAGQDAPSEAVFAIGQDRYAVQALGYNAVRYARTMAPAR